MTRLIMFYLTFESLVKRNDLDNQVMVSFRTILPLVILVVLAFPSICKLARNKLTNLPENSWQFGNV